MGIYPYTYLASAVVVSSYVAVVVPDDSLIRGHFFIEPVPDYGELGCFDLFSKKERLLIVLL